MISRQFLDTHDVGIDARDRIDRGLQVVTLAAVDAVLDVEGHHLHTGRRLVAAARRRILWRTKRGSGGECGSEHPDGVAHTARVSKGSARGTAPTPRITFCTSTGGP